MLALLSLTKISQLNIHLIIFSYVFILFYRLLDDLMCLNYDKKNKLEQFYFDQKVSSTLFKYLTVLIFIFFIFIFYYLNNTNLVILNLLLVFVSYVLYILFNDSRIINFISLLKYPVLIYTISSNNGQYDLAWPLWIFLVFIINELMSEGYLKQNIPFIIFLTIISFTFKVYKWSII